MKRLALILLLLPSVVPCTSQAGDDRVYPESAFLHAGRGGHLIDVTKAPFFARGDGLHDDTAAYAMKDCRAWVFGAKSELCRVAVDLIDCVLDLSGFNYLNWDPSDFPEAPVIQALRSQYVIDGFFWKTQSAQPIVSRDLDGKGGVRDRLAADFPKVDGENGFEVNVRSPEP